VRYVREFLAQFPDESENRHVNFGRAEAEALWRLGKQAEAKAVFQALVEAYPDNPWTYIGWSDEHYLWSDGPKDYESGETILLQALDRPNLEDRQYVLERLVRLYEEWGRTEKRASFLAELGRTEEGTEVQVETDPAGAGQLSDEPAAPSPQPEPPKRNAPCWCGSGKNYKFCHMHSDRRRGQR
jgi:hypothetical protein